MSNIEVEKIIDPVAASDGAGVKLKRSIGTHLIDYHDPFLMLDEFGSENKDDYIGGFPPHPHRGIETVTYMLAGDFEHKDSTGGEGIMTAGDVQWMRLCHQLSPLLNCAILVLLLNRSRRGAFSADELMQQCCLRTLRHLMR